MVVYATGASGLGYYIPPIINVEIDPIHAHSPYMRILLHVIIPYDEILVYLLSTSYDDSFIE